ncbi:MAG: hypothetical protein K0S01_1238 [Herbinix sp.]|jgi:hypothetical protein|nr:hypothetical protein [Herbinix sp.]
MKKKRVSDIQKQYRFEKEANAYLIELSLDDFDDVYDEWDPAPFKKRFIEEEFNEFIMTSAEDIPNAYNIVIVLHLPEDKKNTNKEKSVISAYENFYLYAAAKEKRNWLRLRKKTLMYFMLSLLLLGIGYFYLDETNMVILNVLREGIFIGGWVFLWEAITNIFITRHELISTINLYKRLYLSNIRFTYHSTN